MIPAGLLPEGTKWCIAGGYAACPALAGDIDVWVYGAKEIARGDLGYRADQLLRHLYDRAVDERWLVTPSFESPETTEYEADEIRIQKVATVIGKFGNVHLMVTTAEKVEAILAAFDVSTHQVAIDHERGVLLGPGWTPPQVPPVALLDNSNTPERMQRIAARFAPATSEGMPF